MKLAPLQHSGSGASTIVCGRWPRELCGVALITGMAIILDGRALVRREGPRVDFWSLSHASASRGGTKSKEKLRPLRRGPVFYGEGENQPPEEVPVIEKEDNRDRATTQDPARRQPSAACCGETEQASCCSPDRKSTCCGSEPSPSSCACR